MSCRVQIIGDATKAAAFMPWARKQWANMESGHKTWHFDGVTIEVIRSGESGVVRIMAEWGFGVLLHPRQGAVKLFTHYSWESTPVGIVAVPKKTLHGVAGGWGNGVTPLVGEYIYPLIDADDASYLLGSESAEDDEITGDFADSTGNYGNLYWCNEDADNPVFLSWKGTPTRHFRLANNIEINGFSIQETALKGADEDMPVFTAFGNSIYQNGSVLYTAPRWNWPYTGQDKCFVLGAMQDGNGDIWAIMQSDRYNVPKYVVYFSDGYRIASDNEGDKSSYLSSHSGVTVAFEKEYPTKVGIFTMLWKQGGPVDNWTFVQEWNTGRQGLPWFGNKSGTEFVNSLGSKITVVGTKTDLQPVTGTYKEEMTGGESDSICSHGRFTAAYTDKDFHEFKLDELVYGSRSLSFTATSLKTFVAAVTKVYDDPVDQLYDPDVPEQAPVELHWEVTQYTTTIINSVGTGFNLGAHGGQGNYSVTYSGFTVVDGVVTSAPSCGMGSVTVTDSCGATITREVRLPSGVWITTSPYTYALTGTDVYPGTGCSTVATDCEAVRIGCGGGVLVVTEETPSQKTITGWACMVVGGLDIDTFAACTSSEITRRIAATGPKTAEPSVSGCSWPSAIIAVNTTQQTWVCP